MNTETHTAAPAAPEPAAPVFAFSGDVYHGETATAEAEGFTLTATIHHDPDPSTPWENEDGHGPVTDWRGNGYTGRPPKRPGELVLCRVDREARFYDFAEACKIARRDGWGCEGGRLAGETPRQYAARAAMADFNRLRDWCADRWSYVGVAVTVERAGVCLTGKYEHALWGIESDNSGAYCAQVAVDLAGEAIEAARAKAAELVAKLGAVQ